MNLHEAVGQLILGKVAGTELDADNRSLLRDGTMGGITVFKENAHQLHQLIALLDNVKASCLARPMIAVDQEGGAVQRLDRVIAPLPSMMALGASENSAEIFELAKLSGEQLALLGINVVFAPVLDVNTNKLNPIIGSRAFGDDANLVATDGELLARGYASVGIIPVGKHFPGHGDTSVDSHLQLPLIEHNLERLEAVELVPFRRCASLLPGVLTSHVRVPALDEAPLPASLSHRMTTEWLRGKLGFDGLIFTDDMLMKAIVDNWGLAEACVMSLEAGADQVLVCAAAEYVSDVHSAIVRAVQSGRLTEDRIRESVARRNRIASSVCDRTESVESNEARLIRLRDLILRGTELTEKITVHAISSSVSTSGLSWPDHPITLVVPSHPRYELNFANHLSGGASSVHEVRYQLNPDQPEIDRVANETRDQCVALFTFRAPLNPGQIKLAEVLTQSAIPHLVVAVDTPYDLEYMTGWQNHAAMYDPSEFAVECFCRAIAKGALARH